MTVVVSPQLYLRLAVAFCIVVGLYDTAFVMATLLGGVPGFAGRQWVLFPDLLTPLAAVRAFFEGKLSIVYDIDKFAQFQNVIYADRYAHPVDYRPFPYPPTWLLLLLPLGLLALDRAIVLFMAIVIGSSAYEARRHPWAWLAVATSPAAVHVVLSGQATFFGMALLYGGLRLLERSPIAAGVLFGLLSYKPHFCLLIPIALIAARQWRALFAAAATSLALGLVSLAVLGPQVWIDFIEFTRASSGPRVMGYLIEQYSNYMVTPFFSVLGVGLPKPIASGVQLATAALACVAVWHVFRRYPPSPMRTAVLVAGTFLVSPYMLMYDMLLLMPAVVMLYLRGVRSGFLPLEPFIYAGLWVTPTLCMGFSRHRLPYAPLAILAFGAMAVWHLKREDQRVST